MKTKLPVKSIQKENMLIMFEYPLSNKKLKKKTILWSTF